MLDEIRKRLGETPFSPFFVQTADARRLVVSHPDFVWMPAPGICHIWMPEENASARVNPDLIVSVEGPENWAARRE